VTVFAASGISLAAPKKSSGRRGTGQLSNSLLEASTNKQFLPDGQQDLHPLASGRPVFILFLILFSCFSTFGLQTALDGEEVKQNVDLSDRSSGAISARWWGLGIFSLARLGGARWTEKTSPPAAHWPIPAKCGESQLLNVSYKDESENHARLAQRDARNHSGG
jgi:hypothetical protein